MQRMGFFFRALTQRKLDALDLLESDHLRVEMLFFQLQLQKQLRWLAGKSRREEVFEALKKELHRHMQLEESILYPVCEKIPDLKRLTGEAYEEHKQIKILLKEISNLSIESAKANAKVKMLWEEFQHHIRKEENQIFSRVRILMKKSQIERISRDLRVARQGKVQKIAA